MLFPEWAPSELVEEFNKLQDEANMYRRRFKERVEDGSICLPQSMDDLVRARHLGENYIEIAEEIEEKVDILARLLTWQEMKDVWIALQSYPFKFPGCTHGFLLWYWIKNALRDFKSQMERPKTPAQKVKSLRSVIDKAQALIDAISEDKNASSMAWRLMAEHLAVKNLQYRQDHGESPSWGEFQMPLTLSSDCNEARREELNKVDDVESELEDFRWDKMSLVSRLVYWAEKAEETGLIDLLKFYVTWLEYEVKEPPEIKQPGRSDAAIKPFMIRRLSNYMKWATGKPLDDIVAQIVTTVLNLKDPLTRDDVRPYVAIHGKKVD